VTFITTSDARTSEATHHLITSVLAPAALACVIGNLEARMKLLALAFLCLSFSTAAAAQQTHAEMVHANCPIMHPELNVPAPPDPAMMHRGEMGMGFSQTATSHHFLLKPDGGVIQVEANGPSDADSLASIRMHLHHIAGAFQQGDFDIPMFVHDTVPPGEPEMKRLKDALHYSVEESANGGRVIIHSENKDAVAAVHKFLIFQIEEHKTGDPTGLR
jgi:hypothetical protein